MSNKNGKTKELEEEKKLGGVSELSVFDKGVDLFDLCNDLDAHSHSLRALGTLFTGANLCDFADIDLNTLTPGDELDGEAANLRWGLFQLVDMYLEKQKGIINKACGYKDNVIDCLNRAEHFINLRGQCYDGIKTEDISKRLERALKDLGPIIEGGGDFADNAKKLKQRGELYLS